MISNEKKDELIDALTGKKVTKEGIQARISGKEFILIGETVTVCSITLDNGFSVRGESACVDPSNYNKDIGEKIAFDNAFGKLWQLFGFLLAEEIYCK
ncbi:MAG: Gp49 family protein [Thiohalomonadales bacterium]